MKRRIVTAVCGLCLALPMMAMAQDNLKSDPAYLRIDEVFDLEIAKPEVNVNLPRFLLMNALGEFDGTREDPFAAAGIQIKEVLEDIKLVRVMIIEATDANRKHVDGAVAALRKDLSSKWISVVTIPDDGIGIYAMGSADGGKMAGLAVLIADGGDVIVANIVGSLPLGKVLKMAANINGPQGEMIKKALAEFAGGATANGGTKESAGESASAGSSAD
ncbi:MAG: hypothetical protein RI897_4044 [Verrucomicrobiota bacterium]|jgi:hypothetical protein